MTKEYEKPTETFQPTNEKNTEETSAYAGSLSTTGRLMSYNDQLKESLKRGIHFTEVLDELINTDDKNVLLESVMTLTDYRLDTAYLIFPQQYSRADYYLIFLNRLLQLHQNEQVILQSSDHQNELYHEFPGINMEGYFTFKIDENMREGAYYVDKSTGARLFYINFKRQLIRFNSQALTDLLVVDYSGKFDYKTVKRFEEYLVAIGKYFKEDYGFDVDFNLLDASNNASYQISSADEPREALDKLFIISADAGYMLVAGESGRAVLQLKNKVVVSILRQAEHDDLNNASWVIKVHDEEHKVAWFDILYQYEFIKDWYLDNLTSLAIKSDERFF
ncbi:MAG: hypothetical protein MRZ40_09655 [Ligilactobacillus animalis]|uniref:hypothetical protein n=1 Tax=Ligilactobacillus animalis TaxID=1605 RepID=UPI00242E1933|nr:hypothetical protein [Ligilactobacillus animalis]MCI5942817.1 hypothetical protein [Ligilactobacillus animalis]MDY2993838.1 hypothetical protein [Ligilactobacillus animalis]